MKQGEIYGGKGIRQVQIGKIIKRLKLLKKGLSGWSKVLIVAGTIGVLFIFLPIVAAETKYYWAQTRFGKGIERLFNTRLEYVKEDTKITGEKPDWIVPDEKYSIYIPKIMAKSNVIPNVDPTNPNEYQWALKHGVAEAAGLAHPGQMGTTYLFAHSVGSRIDFVRYNAIFYLLHRLERGDGIEVVYQGKLYKYLIIDKEVVEANDVKYLKQNTSEERLVLQTCFPPGTSWKRLMILAKRSV